MNAKNELINSIKHVKIKCASLQFHNNNNLNSQIILKCNYNTTDYDTFMNLIDLEYNNNLETQELFGSIILQNDTALFRKQFNKYEYWQFNPKLIIPTECL